MIKKFSILAAFLTLGFAHADEKPSTETKETTTEKKEEWIQIFNGKDIKDWTPHFTGHPLGKNFRDTFKVKDGILSVDYSGWDEFKGEFGHLYYNTPYSHYRIRATYRFIGEQVKGGPGWAARNNGLMLHCQDPKTLKQDQKFPACIEVQLLGGLSDGKERGTLNIVTPGTHVFWKGTLQKKHVLLAGGPTIHGDKWVTVEVEVRGDKLKHIINGKTLCEYSDVQLDDGTSVKKGWISIQAETGPIEFKKIEVLPLKE